MQACLLCSHAGMTDKFRSYLNKNILMYKNKVFVYVVWFVVDLSIF